MKKNFFITILGAMNYYFQLLSSEIQMGNQKEKKEDFLWDVEHHSFKIAKTYYKNRDAALF